MALLEDSERSLELQFAKHVLLRHSSEQMSPVQELRQEIPVEIDSKSALETKQQSGLLRERSAYAIYTELIWTRLEPPGE
jgi:hypothetical protein